MKISRLKGRFFRKYEIFWTKKRNAWSVYNSLLLIITTISTCRDIPCNLNVNFQNFQVVFLNLYETWQNGC